MEPTKHQSAFRLPPSAFATQLDVFHGEATPAVARIYARLRLAPETAALDELSLTGRLIGPECAFAHTLPLRSPFFEVKRPGRPAGTLLAEAITPDPCFWTPELPFLYRAHLELRSRGELISQCQRQLGIRRLGVRDGQWFLQFEGKRFVLRGAIVGGGRWAVGSDDEAFARESWTAVVVPQPSDGVCETASRRGVLLVADLTRAGDDDRRMQNLIEELRRLAQWPAVGIALLDSNAVLPDDVSTSAPNLLLAQRIAGGEPIVIAPWAQLAFVEATHPAEFARRAATAKMPVVAVRHQPQPTGVEAARSACDSLQLDLVPHGDYAGYVV